MENTVIARYLEELHALIREVRDGEVASYIPELAKASPELFGICIATADGRVYEAGDSRTPFTIQSISKPLVYGFALDTAGESVVHRKVGVEPTGEAFNSISLEPQTGRPLNPMINAGAIATTGFVPGGTPEQRVDRLLELVSRYVGHPVHIDEAVFRSEVETGHRNRAIAHMLRNFGILGDDLEATLSLYFKQCSIAVTCRDLAVIAATLAAGGVNPVTGQHVVQNQRVPRILSVMTFAGMYDFAGGWGYRVGFPAKSGVAGGLLAVLPGQLGIGVYSPPLDKQGNSVRGIHVCEQLSTRFALHFLNAPRSSSPIRESSDGTLVSSRRRRRPAAEAFLHQHGACLRVFDLQGRLGFSTAERMIAAVEACLTGAHFIVLDFKHVLEMHASAEELLLRLAQRIELAGKRLVLTSAAGFPSLLGRLNEVFSAEAGSPFEFAERDLGLEYCEDEFLANHGFEVRSEQRVPVSETELLRGASDAEIERVVALMSARHHGAGDCIVRQGDPADTIFVLVKGEVRVVAEGARSARRLTTLPAGATFGEIALFDVGPRSAHVYAETDVVCLALSVRDFERLGEEEPRLQAKLLKNMLRNATRTSRRLTTEVTVP